MHFALPPKKSSFPPTYARVSAKSNAEQRRRRLQLLTLLAVGALAILLIFRGLAPSHADTDDDQIPTNAKVLIVTVVDEGSMSEDNVRIMQANRDEYAMRHGYQTFYTNVSTYNHLTQPAPSSWTLVPALRYALTLYSDVDYIWSLSPHTLIMNTTLSIDSHIFSRLSDLMLKDIPVVPPDSVIRTFSHLKPNQAHLVISQDVDNLAHTSFILRNTPTLPSDNEPADSWSQFLLDAWFDPLYRNYAFQKAENHALEHLIQWHPTVLAKLVVVDQRILNSYNHPAPKGSWAHDSMYQPGDFVVNFKGCKDQQRRDCDSEMREYYTQWQTQVEKDDGTKLPLRLQSGQNSQEPHRPLPVKTVDQPEQHAQNDEGPK